MKLLKTLYRIFPIILLAALAAFFIYGFRTDCPDTAGYVYCGAN